MWVTEYLGRASYFPALGGFRTMKDGCGIHPTIAPYAGLNA